MTRLSGRGRQLWALFDGGYTFRAACWLSVLAGSVSAGPLTEPRWAPYLPPATAPELLIRLRAPRRWRLAFLSERFVTIQPKETA